MAKIKRVGFNFFRPVIQVGDGPKQFMNLATLLETIRTNYQRGRDKAAEGYKHVYTYNGEPARLAEVSIDYETQYYHLIFERLDYQVPNRTTLHGDSTALELEEDEYIGIDVSVLYDPENHILMIQRNRSSLGPMGIEMFFQTLLTTVGVDGDFNLAIISDPTATRRAFNQAAYRRINMKVTGLKARNLLTRLVSGGEDIGVDSIEVSFNSRSGKTDRIDEDFTRGLLDEYTGDEDVKKLQIRARENEEDQVEPIDLIDQKLQTFVTYDFREERSLNPEAVFIDMKLEYDDNEEEEGFKNKILGM